MTEEEITRAREMAKAWLPSESKEPISEEVMALYLLSALDALEASQRKLVEEQGNGMVSDTIAGMAKRYCEDAITERDLAYSAIRGLECELSAAVANLG